MDGCRDESATTWPILVRPSRPAKDLTRLDRLSIAAAKRILGEAVTCTHPLRAGQWRELAGSQPMVFSGPGAGHPWPCPLPPGWAGRFSDRTPLPYLPVDPTLIAEIATDAAIDEPFGRPRHGATLVRIRPDLHPATCPACSEPAHLAESARSSLPTVIRRGTATPLSIVSGVWTSSGVCCG